MIKNGIATSRVALLSALDRFTDRTTVHFTFGPKESLKYVIKDAADESVQQVKRAVKVAQSNLELIVLRLME